MNKYLKIFLILFATGLVVGGVAVYYVFNKPHRNIAKEKPAFSMDAEELYSKYSANEQEGNAKFGNKVIQVSGEIVEVIIQDYNYSIVLSDPFEAVSCNFDSAYVSNNKDRFDKLGIGENVSLKGKCDGLDMIQGVVLTRCVILDSI